MICDRKEESVPKHVFLIFHIKTKYISVSGQKRNRWLMNVVTINLSFIYNLLNRFLRLTRLNFANSAVIYFKKPFSIKN